MQIYLSYLINNYHLFNSSIILIILENMSINQRNIAIIQQKNDQNSTIKKYSKLDYLNVC